MKSMLVPWVTLMALTFSPAASAATAKPSKISAFAGKYTGILNYAGEASGTATATFHASTKKETGTLTLSTPLSASGSSILVTETYSFQKHSGIYTLSVNVGGSLVSGTAVGAVAVGKRTITFSGGTANIDGTAYPVSTNIALSGKRGMTIVNTLSGSPGVVLTYQLVRQGK